MPIKKFDTETYLLIRKLVESKSAGERLVDVNDHVDTHNQCTTDRIRQRKQLKKNYYDEV
jgi:hypothetical protein